MGRLFCDDFIFNNKKMSDFGFSTATFETISLSTPKDLALKKTLTTERIGTNPVNYLLNVKYEDVLKFNVTMLTLCNEPITVETFREVVRWLTTKKYEKLEIKNQKYNGYNYYFNCVVSDIQVYESNDIPMGVEFEMTCDAPYAWRDITVVCDKSPHTLIIETDDLLNNVKPVFTFTMGNAGDVTIYSEETDTEMQFTDMLAIETCTVDIEHCILSSNIKNRNLYNSFNRKWIELIPGNNTITFSGVSSLTISARIPMEVIY